MPKIDELPASTSAMMGTELVPVETAGGTRKVPVSDIRRPLGTGPTEAAAGDAPAAAVAAHAAANDPHGDRAYADSQIAALVNSAPAMLDTLNELAAALGNDANFSTTVLNALAKLAGYDLPLSYLGTPGANEPMATLLIPRAVAFPVHFAGSLGKVATNPTAPYTLTAEFKRGGAVQASGTIQISAAGAFPSPWPVRSQRRPGMSWC